MTNLMRIYLAAIGVWLLAILMVFTLPHPFALVTGFGILFFPLCGLALLGFSLVVLFKETKKVIPLLAMPMLVYISVLTFQKGLIWGPIANFYLSRSIYESTVAKIVSEEDETKKKEICGGGCWIMSAADNRIAFHYAHGFLNWHEIVYDPTGKVEAKDWDQKKRVDTYFVGAEHITGNWYVCHFSD